MAKQSTSPDKTLKELRHIRNLLILIALKVGANSNEVDYATGMGAAEVRRMFPIVRGRKSQKS